MVQLPINHCNTCPTNIRGLCCHKKLLKQHSKTVWELRYHNPCEHLNKAGRCKIYNKRDTNPNCLNIEEAKKRHFTLPFGCKYIEWISKIK